MEAWPYIENDTPFAPRISDWDRGRRGGEDKRRRAGIEGEGGRRDDFVAAQAPWLGIWTKYALELRGMERGWKDRREDG